MSEIETTNAMTLKLLLKIFFILNVSRQIKSQEQAFAVTEEPRDIIADVSGSNEKRILLNRSNATIVFLEPIDHMYEFGNTSNLFHPFPNPDNQTQILERQYILRWLPTKKRKRKFTEQEMQQMFNEDRNRKKARESNARMRAYVLETMKSNYWTSLYLYGEVDRIRKKRLVMDEMRKMISILERKDAKHLKDAVLKCYNDAKQEQSRNSKFWVGKNANQMVINVLKDTNNDAVA